MTWHILTGEYPPQPGGVSDYTRLVARGLADAGDAVHVWAPRCAPADPPDDSGVVVHRLPDRFGLRGLRQLTRELDAFPGPRRILVQYVPHAFGHKAANVPFCAWVRSRTRDAIWVMFHEVAYPFDRSDTVARNALAAVNRLMAALVAGAAERVFLSIPGWEPLVRPLVDAATPLEWLPVPSNIRVVRDESAVRALRDRYAGAAPLVGHFGTYGAHIRPSIDAAVPPLIAATGCRVVLIGRRSDIVAREMIRRHPHLRGCVHGTGPMPEDDVSRHIAACDLLLQPYPDGVSTRRASAMAALAHGRAIVATDGRLTESVWAECGAAALVPAGDAAALVAEAVALLRDPDRRARIATAAKALYDERIDIRHTIAALRAPAAVAV